METRNLTLISKSNSSLSGALLPGARLHGVRLLMHLAGADITGMDIASINATDGDFDMERLGQLALTLSLTPRMVKGRLSDLMLESALFAFERKDGSLLIFAPSPQGDLLCLHPDTGFADEPPPPNERGSALLLSEAFDTGLARVRPERESWVKLAREGARNMLAPIVLLTLASNLLGLALPLFTLAVYDQVLSTENMSMLLILTGGLGMAIVADLSIRVLRSSMLARASARIDLKSTAMLFARLLRTPALRTSGMSNRLGLKRLRDLDLLRSFVIGPVGIACIEAPFSVIYLVTFLLLAGWVVVAPLTVLLLGVAFLIYGMGRALRRAKRFMRLAEDYGATCNEIATRLRTIKQQGESAFWLKRFSDASARMAQAEMAARRSQMAVRIASGSLVSLAVLSTLCAGAVAAILGYISVGALIACVALVWRMTAPLAILLQARLRWAEVRGALAASDEVLGADLPAKPANRFGDRARDMSGRVAFSSVMMSHQRGQAAAIRNVSFEIAPGEIVVVTGHSGAGKSTLLDLIAGVLEPQFGAVTIDGVNPRQVSPSVLRQSLGYLPRDHGVLPVTIGEFLGIGVEERLRGDLGKVCERLNLTQMIESLPEGLRTEMSKLDAAGGFVRGLALARVILADPSLILLDEPDASSVTARRTLLSEMERLRGVSTIILVTHEPEFIAAADRVLVLNQGSLVRDCAPFELTQKKQAVNQ